MTRALVTGSTGGLGANIVAALNARDIDVVGLRRSTSPEDAVEGLELTPVTGDILDPASLRRAMEGIDWVFHAAAIADDWHHDDAAVYRVNVEGTKNVLAAAREAGVARVVYTSSAAALGKPLPGQQLMDEHNHFNLNPGMFAYGHSKELAEAEVVKAAGQGLHAVSVLPSAIMGPRDLKFISGELLVRVLKRELMPFPRGGLNFIDMRDCAEAHIAAAERGRPGERYILAGDNLTHEQTLAIIGEVVGVTPRRVVVPRGLLPAVAAGVKLLRKLGVTLPIEQGRVLLSGEFLYYDSSKARRELGLETRPFIDSVRDAYDWYRAHGYFERRGVHL